MQVRFGKLKMQRKLTPWARIRRNCPKLKPGGFMVGAMVGLVLLISCSGSGGGGDSYSSDVDALALPDRISLTAVDDSVASAAHDSVGIQRNRMTSFDSPGTDYSNQTKDVWVDDIEALDMVNDILGVVQDSGYENFVNAGPYKALVRKVDDEQQSQGGSSTTSTATESLMELVVDVTRESNSSPMNVKIWVTEEDGPGGSILIRGYFTVIRGVSDEYPYGEMEAHFKASELDDQGEEVEDDQVFEMAMSVSADTDGNVIVQFVEVGEEEEDGKLIQWDTRARVVANADLSEGKAYVYEAETDWDTEELEPGIYYFAYNADYFKDLEIDDEDGEMPVEIFDKNDLFHVVYRYKLFDAETGGKVTRNSGFPLRLEDGQYAYVGYYGVWAPYGITVSHGDTVTHAESDEEYTLFKVGGKLTKHTRAQIELGELSGVEISVWDNAQVKDFVVSWDGTAFKKIGWRNQGTGQIDYFDEPYDDYTFENEWDGGWCEALKAHLPLGNLTPADEDIVYYHAEATINPTTAEDLTLYFWGFALEAPIDQAVIDGAAAGETAYWQGPSVEKTYEFDAATLLLTDSDEDEVILDEDLDLEDSFYEWGYRIGPLTDDDTYTNADWWQIHGSETYYYWSTGPGEWNQFTTVMDSEENLEAFDPPLRLAYTHETANDLNGDDTHDGKRFSIDYDGFELRIPWYYNPEEEDWMPVLNLKDGTVLEAADGSGDQYVVKAVEEELIMTNDLDVDPDPDLEIDQTIEPPDLTYDETKTDLVGAIPADVELKVIKGELIE
jgi:hypothetical protein